MKDQDARSIILHRLYDLRGAERAAELGDFEDTGLSKETVGRILEQLVQHGLVQAARKFGRSGS